MFKWFYRLQRKREEGFTLIELMVVVVILGVLAAIAVPQLGGKSDDAKDKRARADLKVLESALELYYFDNNAYPDADGTDFPASLAGVGSGKYIKKVPVDPWQEDYIYVEADFESGLPTGLYSKGKDKAVGGSDNIDYLD